MSDSPILEDLPDKAPETPSEAWVMPEPVFRTSEGHTPKQVKDAPPGDEVDTLETETDEMDETLPGVSIPDEPLPAAAGEMPKKKGGCFRSFLFVLGMVALMAAAIVTALIYFLFYSRPADTGTF